MCPVAQRAFSLVEVHRLPEALAGAGVETTELAVTADAVDVVARDDRSADERMQSVGIDFAGAVALPYEVGERAAGVQLEEARSFVEGRHEQAIAIGDGRGDGESVMDAEGVLPVGLAGARVERGYGPGMPDDELGPAADLDQQRGVVAGLPVRGKGAPAMWGGPRRAVTWW